jgi:hypothetical protein
MEENDEDRETPLDFPMSLGHLGDMSVWLAPGDEDEVEPIILQPPGGGFIQSLVPLVEATIRADFRRMARDARRRQEKERRSPSPET